jgi:hypothetical protein
MRAAWLGDEVEENGWTTLADCTITRMAQQLTHSNTIHYSVTPAGKPYAECRV